MIYLAVPVFSFAAMFAACSIVSDVRQYGQRIVAVLRGDA